MISAQVEMQAGTGCGARPARVSERMPICRRTATQLCGKLAVAFFLQSVFTALFLLVPTLTATVPEGLLFHAGFEGTAKAEKSQGLNEPEAELGIISYVPGPRGQAIRIQQGGIHWQQEDNVNRNAGTAMFWMRPRDWDPQAKTDTYEWTFSICGDGAEGDRIQFFKMPNPMLMFFMGQEGHVKQITHRITGWPRGQWRHVAIAWNQHDMRFFLDGKRLARVPVEPENIAVNTGTLLRLQSSNSTDFDELRIFDRTLLDGEISALYASERPQDDEPQPAVAGKRPLTLIPRLTAAAPVIDGHVAEHDWENSALITGFLSIPELELAERQTRVNLTYDAEALYALIITEVKHDYVKKTAPRDSSGVWEFPSAEILIQAEPRDGEPVRQLVLNMFDAKFDQLANDRNWNPDWQSHSTVDNGTWTAEVRLPFSELGIKAPAAGDRWRLNIGRNLHDPRKFSNPTFALAYADTDAFWDIIFAGPDEFAALQLGIDQGSRSLTVTGDISPLCRHGSILELQVRQLPQSISRRRSLRHFDAAPGRIVSTRRLALTDELQLPLLHEILPEPGRYLAQLTLTSAADTPLFYQLFHFQIKEPFATALRFLSKDGIMLVDWELTEPVDDIFLLSAEIRNRSGVPILQQSERVSGLVRGTIKFDITRLQELDYELLTKLALPTGTFTEKTPFKCFYNAEWIGFESQFVTAHQVPAPWQPLQVQDNTVTALCQLYEFSETGMPASIVVDNAEVLAAPVRLAISTQEADLTPAGPLHWDEMYPDKVGFSLPLQGTDVSGTLRVITEFDGMIRYDLTLTPLTDNARLHNLVLEVPFKSDVAQLKYPYRSQNQDWDILELEGEVTDSYTDAFMPHIWVGREERGLAWFAESDEHYEPADRRRVIELQRQPDGTVVLRVNMVTFPQRLTVPTTYTFGLQATPARPLSMENWTACRYASSISSPNMHLTTGYTTGPEYHVKAGVPYPAVDPERARKYVENVHARPGRNALIYSTSNGMGDNAEEFRFFEQEWKNPSVCDTWTFASQGYYHWGTCPTAETLRDFFLWSTARAVDEFNIDGLYYDYATVFPTDNPDADCGYTRDGKRFPTWPIFADREMRKRIYQYVMDKRGHAEFVFHNYSQTVTPIASFSTVHLDGESYQRLTGSVGAKVTDDYTKLLTLGRIRAMFGPQFGSIPYFLPKLAGAKEDYGTPWIKRATRTMIAMLMPHGVPIWGFYCDIPELNRYVSIQDRFGIENSRFTPCYKIDDEFAFTPAPDPDKMLLGYWLQDKRALIVIGNLSDQGFDGTMMVNSARLFGSDASITAEDAFTNQALDTVAATVPVSIGPKDYAMFIVNVGAP